jgi:nicotinate dehydrogenase subunit B
MTFRASVWATRADFRAATGVLLVLRDPPPPPPPARGQPPAVPANPAEGPEVLLALVDEGDGRLTATALAGHVDLGTGIRTAYGQIVAEELGLPMAAVQVILGDTARAPNQGPTIASSSLQLHAQPLRAAAAQARAWLLAQAAARVGLARRPAAQRRRRLAGARRPPPADGPAGGRRPCRAAARPGHAHQAAGRLRRGGHQRAAGRSHRPRPPAPPSMCTTCAAPACCMAAWCGRPMPGWTPATSSAARLLAVDEASIAHLPGIVKLVVQGDFIGIVAEREDQADAAMHALRVQWQPHTPTALPLDDMAAALSAHPSTPRVVSEIGDVEAAIDASSQAFVRTYVWPYQLHASIGPSLRRGRMAWRPR